MFTFINSNFLRILGLVGSLTTGAFTILSTGDIVTGTGIIMAGLSTAGLKRKPD